MAYKQKKELTPEAIKGMKVIELRKHLKRLGLKTTGKKDALVELLIAAIDESDSPKQHVQEMMSKKSEVQKFFQLVRENDECSKIKELQASAKKLCDSSISNLKLCSDRIRLEMYKRNKMLEPSEPMVLEPSEPDTKQQTKQNTKVEVPEIFNNIHQVLNPWLDKFGIDTDFYWMKTYGVLITTIDEFVNLQPYLERLLDKQVHDANKYYHQKKANSNYLYQRKTFGKLRKYKTKDEIEDVVVLRCKSKFSLIECQSLNFCSPYIKFIQLSSSVSRKI